MGGYVKDQGSVPAGLLQYHLVQQSVDEGVERGIEADESDYEEDNGV